MKSAKSKILGWVVGVLVVSFLLIYLGLEGLYFYGLRVLPEDTNPTNKKYSKDFINAQWIAAGESGSKKLTPLSPLKYAASITKLAFSAEIDMPVEFILPSGARVASLNSRELLNREKNKKINNHWHLNSISATIWISNNWTAEEAINNLLKNSYYGHNYTGVESAAFGYFNKSYEKLNIYEIALLVGIEKAPTRYSPWCNPKRSVARMNYIIKSLSQNWPLIYGELSEVKVVPSSLVKYEKECKT